VRVESRRGEVARHALRDDVVVLDDQHLRHVTLDFALNAGLPGSRNGSGVVNKW
jgi:hypothetical protein